MPVDFWNFLLVKPKAELLVMKKVMVAWELIELLQNNPFKYIADRTKVAYRTEV
jgi:hypothetical protein